LRKDLVFEALSSFLLEHFLNYLRAGTPGTAAGATGDSTKVLRRHRASDETILSLIASTPATGLRWEGCGIRVSTVRRFFPFD
jgi:hypothetical protein